MRGFLGALLCGALLAVAPAPAGAVSWKAVTGPTGSIIDEVGTVRGPDGTLHVVWTRNTPGSGGATQDLMTVPIGAGGVVGVPTAIASAYSAIGNPGVVNTPGSGLQVLFGGIQCASSTCPSGLFSATSSDGGKTWSAPTALYDRSSNYGSNVSAVTLADGTPLETWYGTAGVFVHRGSDTSTADYDYQGAIGAGCCGYYSNLAVDSAGNIDVAWDSNATGFLGVWTRALDPSTGAPAGAPMLMPGSVTTYGGAPNSVQMLTRTPIVALPGQVGQFYVAYPGGYPSTSKVLLWHVGWPSSTTIASEPGDHNEVSLAADANDRLWVFWVHSVNDVPNVYARRLGPAGLEPVIDLGAPAHTQSIYAVDGAVSPGGDPEALALAAVGGGIDGTYYARGPQVAPPVNGVGVDLVKISGTVSFKLPGQGTFITLLDRQRVPVGTTIDATHGNVRIEAAAAGGALETADLSGGPFVVTQHRRRSLVSFGLVRFNPCSHHGVRSLFVNGGGEFAAQGHYATATATHSAQWVTEDECPGTLIKVARGSVTVRDLVRRTTVVVHGDYLARP
jgi:hypothetical protein